MFLVNLSVTNCSRTNNLIWDTFLLSRMSPNKNVKFIKISPHYLRSADTLVTTAVLIDTTSDK